MLAEADRLRTVKLAPVCQLGPSEKPPAVRALAVDPATGAIILGTAGCDIVEVGEGRQVRQCTAAATPVGRLACSTRLQHAFCKFRASMTYM